jgi:hypothetical protein
MYICARSIIGLLAVDAAHKNKEFIIIIIIIICSVLTTLSQQFRQESVE